MGCACKSNNGQKAQAAQVVKRTATVSGNVVTKATSSSNRKQIIIRRPAR